MDKKKLIKLSRKLLKLGETLTDKGLLTYEGMLDINKEVFLVEDEDIVTPEDGEYNTEDKVIYIANGAIVDIKDKELLEEEVISVDTRINSIEEELSKLKEALLEQAEEIKGLVENNNIILEGLKELKEQFNSKEEDTIILSNKVLDNKSIITRIK